MKTTKHLLPPGLAGATAAARSLCSTVILTLLLAIGTATAGAQVNLTHVGNFPAGSGTGIAVSADGNTVFAFQDIFKITDVTDPANPHLLSSTAVGQVNCCVTLTLAESRNLVFIGNGNNLYVVDVSNRAAPTVRSSLTLGTGVGDIVVSGNYAYAVVLNGHYLVQVIDVTDPANPQVVTEAPTNPNNSFLGLAVSGTHLYVGEYLQFTGDVRVFDISNPAAPALLSVVVAAGNVGGVVASGNWVFANAYYQGGPRIQAIDATNPTQPVALPPVTEFTAGSMAISGNYLFMTTGYFEPIKVLDISNPVDMRVVGDSGPTALLTTQWPLAAAGNRVFSGQGDFTHPGLNIWRLDTPPYGPLNKFIIHEDSENRLDFSYRWGTRQDAIDNTIAYGSFEKPLTYGVIYLRNRRFTTLGFDAVDISIFDRTGTPGVLNVYDIFRISLLEGYGSVLEVCDCGPYLRPGRQITLDPDLGGGRFIYTRTQTQPPTVSCPAPAPALCGSALGASYTVTINVADADNDALTVNWTVDNALVATHTLAAGATSDSLADYVFGLGSHTVSVSVTDGKSDPVTCGTTVTVNPLPTVSVNSAAICAGGSATLTAVTSASNPSYLWSPGGETTATITVSPSATTTYTVTVTDGATGCANSASGTVTVNPLPILSLWPLQASICAGGSATLEVAKTSARSPSYLWSPGGETTATITVSPTATTTYTLTVTDGATGCANSASRTVIVNPLPTVSVNSAAICAGGSATLTAATSASNPSYLWSPGGATTATITVSPSATTTYTVTVTDGATGCASSASGTVTVNPLPTVSVNSATLCGGSATLTATTSASNPSYLWSPGGATTAAITVSPSSTTTYTVTVIDGVTGCANSGSGTVTVKTFAADGVLWHQPLARNGMSDDTDSSAGGTLKYRFKQGSTIPIQVHALGCRGDLTGNANVTGRVVVYGDTDCDGAIDAGELPIDYNGVGAAGGVMDKIGGYLKFNLDTKKLPLTFKCYILQVAVTDTSTGETLAETVALQAK